MLRRIINLLVPFGLIFGVGLSSAWAAAPSVTAARVDSSVTVDGRLDEPLWQQVSPQSIFTQRQPFVGAPASERTEFRILYDDQALYVGVLLIDSEPDKIVARSMTHDSQRIFKDDLVSVNIDPLHDHRTVYGFTINPLGAQLDGKGQNNGDEFLPTWDGVWTASAARLPDGWSAEFRIPFSTLECDPAKVTEMGLQVVRNIARKQELDDWSALLPPFGSFHASEFGHLSGISLPSANWRKLSIEPYFSTGFGQNPSGVDGTVKAHDTDLVLRQGFDLKYPITRSSQAQITVRPDFAQVDIDDQLVNLNRFSLFFPEKRPFFLEGSQFFLFGVPEFSQLFFSRNIGRDQGREVPIQAGVRSYGREGESEYGILNIQSEKTSLVSDRNVTALRLKQDVTSNTEVGLMATHLQDTTGLLSWNTAAGVDATYRTPDRRLTVETYAAGTESTPKDGVSTDGKGGSLYMRTVWTPGLWEVRQSDYFSTTKFNPGVGYVERSGVFRPTLTVGRSFLLPEKGIKEFRTKTLGNVFYSSDLKSLLDYHATQEFALTSNRGFVYYGSADLASEDVLTAFDLKPGVTIAPNRYTQVRGTLSIDSPSQYNANAGLAYTFGGFFGGTLHELGPYVIVRAIPKTYLTVSADMSWIDLPATSYLSAAVNFSGSYSFTSKMALEQNVRWNRDTNFFALQSRYRWRYAPLSDFFIVYNEELEAGSFKSTFRGLIFKIDIYFSV